MLSLLTGAFGKYIIIGVALVFLAFSVFGYVKVKEHDAVEAAMLSAKNAQLEEVIKENNENKLKLDALIKSNKDLEDKTDALNKQIQDNTDTTEAWINKQIVKTPLDPLFNDTLDKLRGIKK